MNGPCRPSQPVPWSDVTQLDEPMDSAGACRSSWTFPMRTCRSGLRRQSPCADDDPARPAERTGSFAKGPPEPSVQVRAVRKGAFLGYLRHGAVAIHQQPSAVPEAQLARDLGCRHVAVRSLTEAAVYSVQEVLYCDHFPDQMRSSWLRSI